MKNNLKPFYFTSYDPNNSFFKSNSSDKSRYTVYFCSECEKCDAYKKNKCFLLNGLWGSFCPYGEKRVVQGFTKRSKKCSSFVEEGKKEYKDILLNKFNSLNFVCKIGDYIYLPLPHLHNYNNSIDTQLGIINEYLLPIDKFTPDNINTLIQYKPKSLMGEVICSYQEKNVPDFINSLKRYYPEMFKKTLKIYPAISSYIKEIDYKGQIAKILTLNPGKIGLNTRESMEWDGEKLIGNANLISFSKLSGKEKLIIYPDENSYGIILDNDSVNQNTEFFE